jgi:predicted RNA-binding protein with PIN domain
MDGRAGKECMPYLIDGHNLIGRYPGISLEDPEDERKLLEVVAVFARYSRRKVIVFFDRGMDGAAPQFRAGRMVTAHFVPPPRKADDAIFDFLRGRRDLRGYTVVSSDAEVRDRARRAGAKVVASEEFARQVRALIQKGEKEKPSEEPKDIEEWLKLFGG